MSPGKRLSSPAPVWQPRQATDHVTLTLALAMSFPPSKLQ